MDCGAPGPAFFAHSNNYLIDVENAIIVDVEATTAIREAEGDELVQAMDLSGISKGRVSKLCKDIDKRTWRYVADQLRGRWPKLAVLINESEHDVLA